MTTEQAAARRVIDRMRAERAAAGDWLPVPQQREARIVDAAQSEPLAQQTNVEAAIIRAIIKHRAETEAATGTATPAVVKADSEDTRAAQHQNTKEPAVRPSPYAGPPKPQMEVRAAHSEPDHREVIQLSPTT